MNFTSSTLSVETSEVPGLLLGARDKKGNPTVMVPVGTSREGHWQSARKQRIQSKVATVCSKFCERNKKRKQGGDFLWAGQKRPPWGVAFRPRLGGKKGAARGRGEPSRQRKRHVQRLRGWEALALRTERAAVRAGGDCKRERQVVTEDSTFYTLILCRLVYGGWLQGRSRVWVP